MSRFPLSILTVLCLTSAATGAQGAARDSATQHRDSLMADLTVTAIQSLRLKIGTAPAFVGEAGLKKVLQLSPAAFSAVSTFLHDSLGMRVTPASPTASPGTLVWFTQMQAAGDSATMIGRLYGGRSRSGTLAFCVQAFLAHNVWYVWRSQTFPATGEIIGTTPLPPLPHQDPCKDKGGRV